MENYLDILWIAISAGLVFLMQPGFLCLEAGFTRSKNNINVAMKNMSDVGLSILLFWAVGYALMFGSSYNGWIGTTSFFPEVGEGDYWTAVLFLFQVMFCSTAVTILSGAVAERMKFTGYLVITIWVSTIVYPIFGHWVWNSAGDTGTSGWLAQKGFVDFAGSTVVHSVGGWVSLATLAILGSRTGRFAPDGKPRKIPGSNIPLAMLGALLLWFGWFGFNGGSTLALNEQVPGIIANTLLGGAAGLFAPVAIAFVRKEIIEVNLGINGALAGLVAVTASCHAIEATGAVLIGGIGGLIMWITDKVLIRLRIDDAVGAIPVHLGAGIWGTLAVGIFGNLEKLGTGLSRLEQIQSQILGILVCGLWTFSLTYMFVKFYNYRYPLRVSRDNEYQGLNITEHGASTELYDLFRTLENQARTGDLSLRIPVEPFTEVGQIALHYNAVMDELELAINHNNLIVDTVRDGIVSFSRKDLEILSFNPAAETLFGYPESQVKEKSIKILLDNSTVFSQRSYYDFFAPERLDILVANTVREMIGLRADGTMFPMEVMVSKTKDVTQPFYVATFRDITERKKHDSIKNDFISTVNHELRTPLTSIRGALGLLKGGVVGEIPKAAKELVEIADRNSNLLLRLISDILEINKIQSGAKDFHLKPISLVNLLKESVSGNHAYAIQFGVHLELATNSDVTVNVDSDRLIQVLNNLISNAIKFSPQKGTVTIRTEHNDKFVSVAVQDEGSGIPESFKDRIFKKFSQAKSSQQKKGGTGLGLYISKTIIETLGGEIGFESIENQGSTFFFILPIWNDRKSLQD